MTEGREALAAAVGRGEASLAFLSRLIGRNDAYLQQFVTRGTPRRLAEDDRRTLARYLGLDEAALGGPAAEPAPAVARVRWLNVAASAGPGAIVDTEEDLGAVALDPALLRSLGVGTAQASMIRVQGRSMAPLLEDGDAILVDRARRRVGAQGGIYVLRVAGTLMVKRVARQGDRLRVTSDNAEAESPGLVDPAAVEIIGRVMWQSRVVR